MAVELEFDPFAPEIRADPYPTYKRMRDEAPIYWRPDGSPMFTRYDDCIAILRDHERFSNDGSKSKYAEQAGATEESAVRGTMFESLNARPMLFTDPPDHTRIRGLVNKAFTPRVVDRLRPRMETIVDDLLDEVAGAGSMDIIEQVAYPLPVIMIAELLGVPASDRDLLKGWSEPMARTIDPMDDIEPEFLTEIIGAGMAFIAYFAQLINERRKSPRDDLLSALIAAEESGDKLSQEEVIVNLILLLIAGHETTTNLIGNGMLALLRHPSEMADLRGDPTIIKTAVEELLRYDSPVQLDARTALVDVEIAGVTIPKKEQPVLLLAAANRDPAQFPDPDRLDLRRVPNAHIAFSSGIHFCVGASLARAEGQVAINTMLRRMPKMELADPSPPYKGNVTLRGLAKLPVTF
ncbi:MAG: cytochrome P450 [Actinobacteria bacterium]|nr:cytochrome P450 [Actinomycetota bacterium]